MKKKYALLSSLAIFMIIFFQNCGKPQQLSNQVSDSTVGVISANQQFNKYSTEGFSSISLWDFKHYRFLDLNMKTGRMVAFEEAGQVRGETYQLPAEKIAELQVIMQDSEICEPIVKSEDFEGRMCTMAYRYPYAILFEQGEEVRLGEKTDGCDVPVNLCGQKAEQLEVWTKSVVQAL
jgi:hypothetical protein